VNLINAVGVQIGTTCQIRLNDRTQDYGPVIVGCTCIITSIITYVLSRAGRRCALSLPLLQRLVIRYC